MSHPPLYVTEVLHLVTNVATNVKTILTVIKLKDLYGVIIILLCWILSQCASLLRSRQWRELFCYNLQVTLNKNAVAYDVRCKLYTFIVLQIIYIISAKNINPK